MNQILESANQSLILCNFVGYLRSIMATLNFDATDKNIYKDGAVVGTTDLIVHPVGGYLNIPDILVKGNLDGQLEYGGKKIVIEQVEMAIGMEVGPHGMRGPIWKNVRARVLN